MLKKINRIARKYLNPDYFLQNTLTYFSFKDIGISFFTGGGRYANKTSIINIIQYKTSSTEIAHLVGAAEYTECISADGVKPPTECPDICH